MWNIWQIPEPAGTTATKSMKVKASILPSIYGLIPRRGAHSQAVHDGSPLALLALALPLVHLQDQLEEGTLGGGHFSVPRPSQVLELANHQVAFLWLRDRTVDFPSQSQTEKKQNMDSLKKIKLCSPWWGCRLWRVDWWRRSPLNRTYIPPGPGRNAAFPLLASTEDNPEHRQWKKYMQ